MLTSIDNIPLSFSFVGNVIGVYNSTEVWLGFFGSYIGSIIGAVVTFLVLYFTIKSNDGNTLMYIGSDKPNGEEANYYF